MICPVCGGKTLVVDSRAYTDHIHRVRKCQDCNLRFSTVEVDEDLYSKIKEGQNHHVDCKQSRITITRSVGHRN